MDASKYKRSKSRQDWISFEYKRRVWWFLYIRNVIIGLNYGTIIKISSNDMAVNFPSNDYYFQNYNSDPSLKNYELTDCTKAINENKRDKRDEAYVLVKSYLELGIASDFINKTRLCLYNKSSDYYTKLSYIKSRINKFEHFLGNHYSYLEIDKVTLLPKSRSSNVYENKKYALFFVSTYTIRVASIITHMIDIVPYSLDPDQLERSKAAKNICIYKAIETITLIKSSMTAMGPTIINICIFYAVSICGAIFVNSVDLLDHPKHRAISESFKYVLEFFKKYCSFQSSSSEFENSKTPTSFP
ncbi:hypothetical protein AYI70_g3712 [Smittium culicis]|uniref:Xylanolytic transcriptional activator regulatory domain-containing protein n=1 Tax=Smittium culicis TaxID=133412 RepID=A0A1R1Y2Q1_9FUNG|nr:hypothetical protein AYI70_g3712 [Smittium culicis]